MSVTITTGNIFYQDVACLVNPVNCKGTMGKGLALQFKKKFPANFKKYKAACDNDQMRVGEVFITGLGEWLFGNSRIVCNFPTKDHWQGDSELWYIEEGMADLAKSIRMYAIPSIAIPALGCGLGGLEWDDVRPIIRNALEPLPNLDVVILSP